MASPVPAMRALLAAALLLLATSPALASEACAPVRADRLEALASLPGLPEGWLPFLALDDSRLPPIPRVAASGPTGLCDLTADVAGFARAAGVHDPFQLATLAAAVSYPDQLGIPEPRSPSLEGGIARLTTWSAKDGLLADWTIELATLRTDFVVTAVGVGAAPPEHGFEGWHPWVGFSSQYLRALDAGALASKQLLVPNGDGTTWRFTYFTQNYASEAQADSYAAMYGDAGKAIYAVEVGQWGFASGDPDKVLDVTMDGCSCIFGGFNVNIHVHAKLEDLIRALNLQYPSNQHFYRIVIGHEWHHHLQYSINQWKLGSVLTEGGARFSETVFEPEGAFGPKTIQYLPNANGFSNVVLNTNLGLGSRTYDFGLFWGYLYSADGGITVLREVYEEANNVPGSSDLGVPQAVTRALKNVSEPLHDTFYEAYADFAVQMYKKSFVWGKADGSEPRDWGLYLPAVRQQEFQQHAEGAANLWEGLVAFNGLLFGRVQREDPLLTHYAGDGALVARWVWTTPGAVMVRPAGLVYVLQDGPVLDASLVLLRGPAVPNDVGQKLVGTGKFRAAVGAPFEVAPPLPALPP